MRTIRVLFDGFGKRIEELDHNSEAGVILSILRKHYKVTFCEEPEYVFYNQGGKEYYKHDGIRIFCTIEALCPDFNLCDYGIGYEYLAYGDRYFRFPNFCFNKILLSRMAHKQDNITEDMAERKFCSFVYSNGLADNMREDIFHRLCRYRMVDSGGRFLNNQPDAQPILDKYIFERRHKFSIACENASHPGYHTEKLAEAFAAKTIPIYWGDPDIEKIFNRNAFINVNAYTSLDMVAERVEYLDTHPEEYLAALREPALLEDCSQIYKEAGLTQLEKYLTYIIDQPYEMAFRRNRGFWGRQYLQRKRCEERILEKYNKMRESIPGRLLRKMRGNR